jgi:hypothetical protein
MHLHHLIPPLADHGAMQFCRATVNQLSSKRCMYPYMNTKNPFYDPSVWRNRAAQTRAKADLFAHPQSKERLLRIAEEYDRLAQHAEEWQMTRKQE